jgi:hypothetical protein
LYNVAIMARAGRAKNNSPQNILSIKCNGLVAEVNYQHRGKGGMLGKELPFFLDSIIEKLYVRT